MNLKNINKFRGLLDLQDPMKEAVDKLVGTYIEINGEIVQLLEIHDGADTITICNLESDSVSLIREIESINFFLPEAGNYPIPGGGFINVQKKPNRQYARSLKLENYLFNFYTEPKTILISIVPYLHLLVPENRETITKIGNKIYYLTTQIGLITKSMFTGKQLIMCTNEFFEQELTEWSKHYENR